MNESPEELASLYVLDQLDAPARTAFEARLLREPELAALVRGLESGLAHGVRSLPQKQPPADLFAKIESAIDATDHGWDRRSLGSEALAKEAAPVQPARSAGSTFANQPWIVFARWGIAAVIAVSLGILAVQSLRRSSGQPTIIVVGLDANRNTFAELPLDKSAKDPDARFIQLASLAENFWQKPGELPAAAKSASGDDRGYALFDPASQQGFIAIEQLASIAADQRYHLWVVDSTNGQIHDAGILPLSDTNHGLYSFTIGDNDGLKAKRPHFFVTVEDSGITPAPAKPRGKVVLGKREF